MRLKYNTKQSGLGAAERVILDKLSYLRPVVRAQMNWAIIEQQLILPSPLFTIKDGCKG